MDTHKHHFAPDTNICTICKKRLDHHLEEPESEDAMKTYFGSPILTIDTSTYTITDTPIDMGFSGGGGDTGGGGANGSW